MVPQAVDSMRKSGINYIEDIPWGTHLCAFYESERDLIGFVLPFLRAGLERNEYCIWVVPESMDPAEVREKLSSVIQDFPDFSLKIEIISYEDWYLNGGTFDNGIIIDKFTKKLGYALEQGCDGLRVCGTSSYSGDSDLRRMMQYEALIDEKFKKSKMSNIIALCPYQLSKLNIYEILSIVNNHSFSFVEASDDYKYGETVNEYNRINTVVELAAEVVHEIRNPMTSVIALVQLLQTKSELSKYSQLVTTIVDELHRANGIITEYLSLATNKDNKIKHVNLNEILESISPLLRAEASKTGVQIVLNTDVINEIKANPQEIRQVILNLTRNGIEAMPGSGDLTIRTYMENDFVVLEIEDQGRGIPSEIISKIGEPFFTTKTEGTGLGLHVSQQILKKHNAIMDLKSSNKGTLFKISFPHVDSNDNH